MQGKNQPKAVTKLGASTIYGGTYRNIRLIYCGNPLFCVSPRLIVFHVIISHYYFTLFLHIKHGSVWVSCIHLGGKIGGLSLPCRIVP